VLPCRLELHLLPGGWGEGQRGAGFKAARDLQAVLRFWIILILARKLMKSTAWMLSSAYSKVLEGRKLFLKKIPTWIEKGKQTYLQIFRDTTLTPVEPSPS
jgi:hypothetical protein